MAGRDESQLRARLDELDGYRRAAFAAACAERLLSAYGEFHLRAGRGDPQVIKEALGALWQSIVSKSVDAGALERLAAECEELVPNEDDWTDLSAYAQHAAAAAAYALRCRAQGDSQSAVWAARQVYEALDYMVVHRNDIDVNALAAEERIFGDPAIQNELRRQSRDVTELLDGQVRGAPLDTGFIRQFRERAGTEAIDLPAHEGRDEHDVNRP